MTIIPLSLRPPSVGAFLAGRLTRLRRPLGGVYDKVRAGDLLWLREPFRLPAAFGQLAPLDAERQGAIPWLEPLEPVDPAAANDLPVLGPWRPAHTMPRAWSRAHARVIAVDRQPLQLLTEAEAEAEGFRDRGDWADAWDQSLRSFFAGDLRFWQNNPQVIVMAIEVILAPLPRSTPRSQPATIPAPPVRSTAAGDEA